MREKSRTKAVIRKHGESSSSWDGLCHHQRLVSSLMHIQGRHTSLPKSQLVLGLFCSQTPAWRWQSWGQTRLLITRPSSPSQNGHCYRCQHHQAGFPSWLGPVYNRAETSGSCWLAGSYRSLPATQLRILAEKVCSYSHSATNSQKYSSLDSQSLPGW